MMRPQTATLRRRRRGRSTLSASELKAQAAAFWKQAAQARRLAGSLADDQERLHLLRNVQELEEEAAFMEALAGQRDTDPQ